MSPGSDLYVSPVQAVQALLSSRANPALHSAPDEKHVLRDTSIKSAVVELINHMCVL